MTQTGVEINTYSFQTGCQLSNAPSRQLARKCCLQNSGHFSGLNNKTVLLCDTVHQISRGESAAAGVTAGQPRPLTPRGRSGGPYHVITQFYFYPVMSKIKKFNPYLPVNLTLKVSNSRFRKPVMFWRWHHHGVALWRQGRGAGHNCLLLTRASNVNCSADVANHVTRLWQAGDTENFERRITG